MFPYKTSFKLDRKSKQGLYLQLANQFIDLIKERKLIPNTKLPGSRILANLLNVHRKTVVACYEELLLQGWVESIPKKGTFVHSSLPLLHQTEFLTSTSGTGLMYHVFDHFGPQIKERLQSRQNGVLIANLTGKALGFALWNLQERGSMMIDPGTEVYEGMIVGIHTRNNDLVVNVIKGKQLTNVRASGTDENIQLTPAIKLTLEQAIEFINDDELVEVTPAAIRLRKRFLKEVERKRSGKKD
mgnify:CR=1 FL=1